MAILFFLDSKKIRSVFENQVNITLLLEYELIDFDWPKPSKEIKL